MKTGRTIRDAIVAGAARLSASPSARLDAELLLAHALGVSRVRLIAHSSERIPPDVDRIFDAFLQRRAAHEPVAYIIGLKEFFGRDFAVNRHVLVPRPDTELVVETALQLIETVNSSEPHILDLGTGSGCIAISIALALAEGGRSFRLHAVDRSSEALEVARKNATIHGISEKITFHCGSWFQPIDARVFDLIVSNPPYVAERSLDTSPELAHEPSEALYSGVDGLDAVRYLLRESPRYLAPEGYLLIEIGANQGTALIGPQTEVDWSPFSSREILLDLAGLPRMVRARRLQAR